MKKVILMALVALMTKAASAQFLHVYNVKDNNGRALPCVGSMEISRDSIEFNDFLYYTDSFDLKIVAERTMYLGDRRNLFFQKAPICYDYFLTSDASIIVVVNSPTIFRNRANFYTAYRVYVNGFVQEFGISDRRDRFTRRNYQKMLDLSSSLF